MGIGGVVEGDDGGAGEVFAGVGEGGEAGGAGGGLAGAVGGGEVGDGDGAVGV